MAQEKKSTLPENITGLELASLVLTMMFYKVPSVTDTRDADIDGEWWAAELRDKNVPIRWDKEQGMFCPSET